MFLNDLYTIIKTSGDEKSTRLSFIIQLNPSHRIFSGHFPGNPILPGVCVVQILKELLMEALGKKIILKNAGTIKFLAFINPVVSGIVSFDIELKEKGPEDILCDVTLSHDSVVYCRFKGEFRVINS